MRPTELAAWARRHWAALTLAVALCAASAIVRPDATPGLFRLEPPPQHTYRDLVNDGAQLQRDAAVEGDVVVTDGHAGLHPGGRFRIAYSFQREPDERVFLMLRFYWRPYLETRVTFAPEGGPPASAANTNLLGSPPLDITPYLGRARRFQIILEALAHSDAPLDPIPIFDSIEVRRTKELALPPLPLLFSALAVALCAYIITGWFARSPAGRGNGGGIGSFASHPLARIALSTVVFGALLLISRRWAGQGFERVCFRLAIAALVAVWATEGWQRLRALRISQATQLLTLFVVMTAALATRWAALPAASGMQIEPDAQGYIRIARAMSNPFHTEVREPALIWWVWIALRAFGDHEASLRVMSCLLAVVSVGLTFFIARRVMPGPLALLAALLVALSAGYVRENVRGLRLEGYIVALQLLALVLLSMPRRPKALWIAGAGLAAGFVVLSNLAALSFAVLLLIWFGLRRRWRWYWWLPAFALMLALPAPYLIYSQRTWGDAFHASNVHAVFYRNQEFQGRPGYPSVEEVARDSYTGPPLTTAEYIFEHHTPAQILGRSARGFLRLYAVSPERVADPAPAGVPQRGVWRWVSRVRDFVFDGRGWLLILYLMGLAAAALRREWDLLVFYVAINLTSFFLAATPRIFFDPRLYLHYLPFACLFPPMALLMWPAAQAGARWWRGLAMPGRRPHGAGKKERATRPRRSAARRAAAR
ncbi:MAG: hypothetical protein Kow0059_07970 [Candidatus Sumerlaeia bacterium]